MAKKKDTDAAADLGADQVQQRVDKENAQGFSGVEVDPTPNENYTVEGVTAGAPTPETDDDARTAARDAAGLNPDARPTVSPGEMVTVKDAQGKEHQMSRKAFELSSDKFTEVK